MNSESATLRPNLFEQVYTGYARLRRHRGQARLLNLMGRCLPNSRILAQTPSGWMRLDVKDGVQNDILRNGAYEPKTVALLARLVHEGDCFVDVGAHVGQFTLQASRLVGPAGKVVAIEPNPETFADLQTNLALNGCSNVRPVLCATSGDTELLRFEIPPAHNRGASREAGSDGVPQYSVAGFPLSVILRHADVKRVHVMKIDVEGSEYRVLNPFLSDVGSRPSHLIFEFIPEYFSYAIGAPAFLDFVSGCGYTLHTVDGQPCRYEDALPEFNVWARRTDET